MTSQLFRRRMLVAPLLGAVSLFFGGPASAQFVPQIPNQYPSTYPQYQPAAYGPAAYGPAGYSPAGGYPASRLSGVQPRAAYAALAPGTAPSTQLGHPGYGLQAPAASPADAPIPGVQDYLTPSSASPVAGVPQANYPPTSLVGTGKGGAAGAPGVPYADGSCATGGCAPGVWGTGACGSGGSLLFNPWAGYTQIGGCGRGLGYGGSGYGAAGADRVGWAQTACRQWFGGIYGLYMDHDDENEIWLSFDSTVLNSRLLGSRSAAVDWQAGSEVRFGSTLLCVPLAWEVVYWGLYDKTQTASVTAIQVGNPISTSLDFSGLDYDPGTGGGPVGVNSFYDTVEAHRVRRHFEIQNIEINLIRFPLFGCVGPCGVSCGSAAGCGDGSCAAGGCGPGLAAYANAGSVYGGGTGNNFGGMYGTPAPCGPRFTVVTTAGIRYVRVDDGFNFAASATDATFGNEDEDMFFNIETENHYIGGQIGCAVNYQHSCHLSFYADSKFGIYADHVRYNSQIFGRNGFAVVAAGLPFAGQAYNVQSTKNDVAFLGEVRLGVAYMLKPSWRLYGGWRAVALSGIALPTNQPPQNFADIPGATDIESNGSMIIHGLQAGVEVSY